MSRGTRRRIAGAVPAGAAAAAWLLWRFPPASSSFYPRCPIHALFHIDCPGCGGTRALSALLHGRMADALHCNPLIVTLLPFALAFLVIAWVRAIRDADFRWPEVPGAWVKATLAAAIAFTMIRNLPYFR